MEMRHPQLERAIPELTTITHKIHDPKSVGGLAVIYGSNGCGKTHIARRINKIFNNNRMTIGPVNRGATSYREQDCSIVESLFVHWPTAIAGIKNDQWFVFEDCCVEYFVTLDDIGAEHDPSGIGLEKLYLILNRRERMHTIVTTNYPPSMWEEKFERRIASRMFRNATHIDLSQVPDFNA